MKKTRTTSVIAAGVCALNAAAAAETTTYTYDVFGRVRSASVFNGPANGVQRTYDYDATDNRVQYVVTGSVSSGAITLAPTSSVANTTSVGVAITVNVAGTSTPTGMVTFTEDGVFLGSAFVYSGQATVILEGFPPGTHTIVVTYSGDGTNASTSQTFTIKVQNLAWLPAVLEVLLAE